MTSSRLPESCNSQGGPGALNVGGAAGGYLRGWRRTFQGRVGQSEKGTGGGRVRAEAAQVWGRWGQWAEPSQETRSLRDKQAFGPVPAGPGTFKWVGAELGASTPLSPRPDRSYHCLGWPPRPHPRAFLPLDKAKVWMAITAARGHMAAPG